mmetsp:Transcript_4877/g.18302  ORF Transcript_4877/g.18302 Transcript_4877/m.18302 type:complete len:607 (-) Transcript_4877:22-1842(-)|eukprot:CAMPEP_0117448046 /NCGR_PEP_ID=MMETSP0759-20121206/7192_1 /TAXON_ID=63605 /ORGANISM="Percolomonas cosmopolitus, Strain WS" /LENGTH=606 /DNA_ID=CAMNT_0005240407 /DNA_START=93 /DNA_END=1913 /DNA_ORIENTATION=-
MHVNKTHNLIAPSSTTHAEGTQSLLCDKFLRQYLSKRLNQGQTSSPSFLAQNQALTSSTRHHLVNVQYSLGALRELYSKQKHQEENHNSDQNNPHQDFQQNSRNLGEELWKWYDDERLSMQFGALGEVHNEFNSDHVSYDNRAEEACTTTIDCIQQELLAFFSESDTYHHDSFHSLLQKIQDIWIQYLPSHAQTVQKHNQILAQHRIFQSAISQREREFDHLFLTLSHQLDQHLSESVVYERWRHRQRMKHQSPVDLFLRETNQNIQNILFANYMQQNQQMPGEETPVSATDAYCHAFRGLFSEAFKRAQRTLKERKRIRTQNMHILSEIVSFHYRLLLEEWSSMNRQRVLTNGEYHLVRYMHAHQLHERLRTMPLFESTGLIFELLRPHVKLKKDVNMELSFALCNHLPHYAENSVIHPGFERIFRRYSRGLVKSLFSTRGGQKESLSSLFQSHLPRTDLSESEFYDMVTNEFEKLEFEHNEAFYKKKFEEEFSLTVPRDVASEAPEVVLQFLIDSGQIDVERVPSTTNTFTDNSILQELMNQAEQKRSLPVPNLNKTALRSPKAAHKESHTPRKSISEHFEDTLNHEMRREKLYQKLESGLQSM